MFSIRSLRVLIPLALVALGAVGWTRSQDYKPTPPNAQQQYIARMAGTWDAKIAMTMGVGGTVTSTGIETNVLVCGGKWLTTELHFEFMGMPYEGRGLLGWDGTENKFTGVWVDNMSESLTDMEGGLTDGTLTWDYEATMMGMTNKIHDDMTWDGDDKRVLVSSFKLDSGLQEHMRIEYTKRVEGSR